MSEELIDVMTLPHFAVSAILGYLRCPLPVFLAITLIWEGAVEPWLFAQEWTRPYQIMPYDESANEKLADIAVNIAGWTAGRLAKEYSV